MQSTNQRPITLINSSLKVQLSARGAELLSVQSLVDDTEYVWNGDAAFWNRRAPHLFPIVGRLRNDSYTHKGTQYSMKQHGFARDSLFELQNSDDTSAHFILSASEETRSQYPFDFDLYVHYKLSDNTLHTTYELVHTFGEPLPYALGTHPAFMLGGGSASIEAHTSLPERATRLKDGLIAPDEAYPHSDKSIALTEATFADDALIFKNFAPSEWRLIRGDGKSVTVAGTGFSHSALWSKPHAPFVCIELWTGHADSEGSSDNLTEKESVHFLKDGSVHYSVAYTFE